MQVIGNENQTSEDVFDFMISFLPFPQKSIHSELTKLFSISIYEDVIVFIYTQRIKTRRVYFKPEIKYDIGLHLK